MTDNEGMQHERQASPGDLLELFHKTRGWLERKGDRPAEPSETILDLIDDAAVVDTAPRYEFTIPEALLRRFADRAADDLRVGEALTLVYFPSHDVDYGLAERSEEYEGLSGSRCAFVKIHPSEHVTTEAIAVNCLGDQTNDDDFSSDRFVFNHTSAGEDTEDDTEVAAKLAGYVIDLAAKRRAEETGANRMTYREFKALDEIVDSLDDIYALMNAVAPDEFEPKDY